MAATSYSPPDHGVIWWVSVPYSSGQWLQPGTTVYSLPTEPAPFQSPIHRVNGCNKVEDKAKMSDASEFQSPIHRVNGCNSPIKSLPTANIDSFSPLFIGSMAATITKVLYDEIKREFQSPIHRVNGCNSHRAPGLPGR